MKAYCYVKSAVLPALEKADAVLRERGYDYLVIDARSSQFTDGKYAHLTLDVTLAEGGEPDEERLTLALNEWFAEAPLMPPNPIGTLVLFNVERKR